MAAQSSTDVAATGDEVGRLYAAYGAKLHRFCRGRLRSTEEAEDAVQTTFLRVYTALRQGTVPQYEAAWLYKIAHNVCLSRIESSERRARIESPQDFSLLEEELAAPTGRSDELVGLADALAAMPPNLRQAILLREWQGLSYAEISEALGVSVSAVESLIFRARRHLANALVEPAKKLAGALNLPWLAGAARALLANFRNAGAEAGLGTKIAVAGVGLIAIGGGGAGVGLTVGASGHPRPALTVLPAAASAPAAGVGAPALAPRGEMAAVVAKSGAPAKRPAEPAKHAKGATPPASAPGKGDPPSPTAPGATPTTPPTGADPPATTPTRPGSTAPPATTPAAPKPKLPLVPNVPLPALPVVTIPAVTVPPVTVTVPPVTVPLLPLPVPVPVPVPPVTVTVPAITTPTVTLP